MNTKYITSFIFFLVGFFFLGALTTYAAILAKPPNNLGLVGYWSFNDGGGDDATDFSGNSRIGTLTNMSDGDWVSGKRGGALDFDGTDDYVNVGNIPLPGEVVSVSAWVRFDTLPSGDGEYETIMSQTQTGVDGELMYALFVRDQTGASPVVFTFWGAGNFAEGTALEASDAVETGRWYHVLGTYDGATDGTLYVDGVLVDSTSTWADSGATTLDPAYIGRYTGGGSTGEVDGIIDEVRVYNRVVAAEEARAIYESGRVLFNASREIISDGLVGYWTLDAQDINWRTNTLSDASGNSSDGNLENLSTTTSPTFGIIGQALDFDGDNHSADIGTITKPEGADERTITAWFNADAFDTGPDAVFISYSRITTNGRVFEIGAEDGAVSINFQGHRVITPQNALETGSWYHVAAVVPNGATVTSDVDIYVDGVLQSLSDEAGSAQTLDTGSSNSTIGARSNGAGSISKEFDGRVDEVRFYDRALSVDEIKRLYNTAKPEHVNASPTGSLTNGLVGYWTFDGPDVNWGAHTVSDRSGNDFTGLTPGMSTTSDVAPGRIGQALRFRGQEPAGDSEGRVGVASFNHGIGTGDFTVSIHAILFEDTGSSIQGFLGIEPFDPGFIYYKIGGGGGPWGYYDGTDYQTTSFLNLDQWYHLVVRRTGTTLEFFRDGVRESSSYTYSDSISNGDLLIGRPDDVNARAIDGLIDEVRIYDRSLSDDEIQRLYRMGGGQ